MIVDVVLKEQVIEFEYDDIERYDISDEDIAFLIDVNILNKPKRQIKIYTPFVS